ncbi:MAG: NlpC/P60 family protein [Elusimicrobia bacterium]|nr:NlpC/P60 family protein [Elusimicrobiota bacterium]
MSTGQLRLATSLLLLALPLAAQVAEAPDPSLTADLAQRDRLPQSDVPRFRWSRMRGWGPAAAQYPPVPVPLGKDPAQWRRQRVIAVAKRYIGLSYRHHHIPGWHPSPKFNAKTGPGLDCSNFTSWVYNYGLGIKFDSEISKQSEGPLSPGRVLGPDEPLAPGDLLYILKMNRQRVSHVVIYIDPEHIIDSHAESVGVRRFAGWYKTHLSHARRVIE